MTKLYHEIRDPIHQFIKFDSDERKVIDSLQFQRLRNIHQLAMTYMVYPGASHKRFEHSLGVMELSSRVFDIITDEKNLHHDIRVFLPEITDESRKIYWRRVLRMAALCHDLGHLPFSHAAEKALLPEDWSHEKLTREIIQSDIMMEIWQNMTPPLRSEDIIKLAIGKRNAKDLHFSILETILSEIIIGDAFGVDRIDYLLRDSHHLGVAYGKFDHYRLIDTLRILPAAPKDDKGKLSEPELGIEEGGIQSAESLLLARYLMFSQVYFHHVRRIYDIHLKDFLNDWLPNGKFSTNLEDHFNMTDIDVILAIKKASNDDSKPGHVNAKRITDRDHFRLLYSRDPNDLQLNRKPGKAIFTEAIKLFGIDNIRHDKYEKEVVLHNFPIITRDNEIFSSISYSQMLQNIPSSTIDFIFVNPEYKEKAKDWLNHNKKSIIKQDKEVEE